MTRKTFLKALSFLGLVAAGALLPAKDTKASKKDSTDNRPIRSGIAYDLIDPREPGLLYTILMTAKSDRPDWITIDGWSTPIQHNTPKVSIEGAMPSTPLKSYPGYKGPIDGPIPPLEVLVPAKYVGSAFAEAVDIPYNQPVPRGRLELGWDPDIDEDKMVRVDLSLAMARALHRHQVDMGRLKS